MTPRSSVAALRTVALGLSLGFAAFIPDWVPESAAPFVEPMVSSGFAWGFIALLCGYLARQPKTAVVSATSTLLLATVTYYALILFVSQRWYVSALESESGVESFDGLWAIARSLGLWTVGSVCAGGIMGWLGHTIRTADLRLRAAASGLALGLLAGQGFFTLLRTGSIWIGPLSSFELSKLVPAVFQLLLATATIALMIRSSRNTLPWRLFAISAAVSLLLNLLIWYAVETARIALY